MRGGDQEGRRRAIEAKGQCWDEKNGEQSQKIPLCTPAFFFFFFYKSWFIPLVKLYFVSKFPL